MNDRLPILKKDADDILKKPYARIFVPEEDGSFSAEMMEFPGCFAIGETIKDAFDNLEKAAQSWVNGVQEADQTIPQPASSREHSGRIALRLPRGLHRAAAKLAEREKTSLTQWIVSAIAERVGAKELYNRLAQDIRQKAQIVSVSFSISLGEKGELPRQIQLDSGVPSFQLASATANSEQPHRMISHG